jgi:hypothetical protein
MMPAPLRIPAGRRTVQPGPQLFLAVWLTCLLVIAFTVGAGAIGHHHHDAAVPDQHCLFCQVLGTPAAPPPALAAALSPLSEESGFPVLPARTRPPAPPDLGNPPLRGPPAA